MPINETPRIHFLYKFLQSPKQIGSVTPSSSYLVNKMLDQVQWGMVKNVAELGAGTGVFTKGILDRKKKDCQVVAYEYDHELRRKLSTLFPQVIMNKDANDLKSNSLRLGIQHFDCVISGLPFSNFSQSMREGIFQQVSELLSEDGVFIAFQYSLHMKKMLSQYFKNVKILFTPFNFPPAFIYVCKNGGGSNGFRVSG
ncbi:MAG TPA: methyltransferase domain-containing protein [Pseudoneobacillus sp.]|nr:methyltransferase domain-containing protein [Pseudoneobacillus sp.]